MHFNITPPSSLPTSESNNSNKNNNNRVASTSQLSLVINKAESIEESKESEIRASSSESLPPPPPEVIEEVISVPTVVFTEQKASISERQKSRESFIEIRSSLPASISTQTLPTDEFPEPAGTTTSMIINQVSEATNQQAIEAPEIDRKTKGIKKAKSRSIEEKKATSSDGGIQKISIDDDEEQLQKCYKITHQQSLQSQEDDYEISMVTGLLPGCVGKLSIFKFSYFYFFLINSSCTNPRSFYSALS